MSLILSILAFCITAIWTTVVCVFVGPSRIKWGLCAISKGIGLAIVGLLGTYFVIQSGRFWVQYLKR